MAGQKERAEALSELQRLEQAQARWEAEEAAAVAEGADLRARMGSEVLDDPEVAASLAEALSSTSSRAEVAAAAAAAAVPRLQAARLRVLELDAAEFDRQAEQARKRLQEHEKRTGELLKLLAEHEGEFAPAVVVSAVDPRSQFVKPMKSHGLHAAVSLAELRAEVLRAMLRGEDPRPLVEKVKWILDGSVYGVPIGEFWPAAVRPGGILPVERMLRERDVVAG